MKRFAVGDKFRVEDLFGGNGYWHEVTKIWTEKGLDGTDIKYMETREAWTNEDTWENMEETKVYAVFEDATADAEVIKVWEWNGEAGYEWATNEERKKEEATMMRIFKLDGVNYKTNDKGNYFYKSTGRLDKQGFPVYMRIPAHVFEKAFDEFVEGQNSDDNWDMEDEVMARKEMEEKKDRETEDNFNKKEQPKTKKAAKPRKSKDIAWAGDGINAPHTLTLTTKQVDFIKHLPDTNFWEHGLDSMPWCDVLADEIGGQFAGKPMTVGAMISTLREKHLINVGMERVNGKKAKYLVLTDLGKKVAKELGLN